VEADGVAAFVHEPVVSAAQGEQVAQAGFSALCPVVDVVSVHKPGAVAAGEPAAAVAGGEGAAEGGRDRPPLPAHRQDLSLPLVELDDGAVAGQPSGGLDGDRPAVGELAPAVGVCGQGGGVDVDDHLVALTPGPVCPSPGEGEVGDRCQRFRVRGPGRYPVRGGGGGRVGHGRLGAAPVPQRLPARLQRPDEQCAFVCCQPAPKRQPPLLGPEVVQELPLLVTGRLLPRKPPVRSHTPAELGRRHHPRQLQQLVLGLRGGHTDEDGHLRIRQLPPGERGVDQRQLR
jgi:hypothetical protein